MRAIRFALVVAFVWVAVGRGGEVRGQALADRVPADALLYAGWAGAEKLGPAYSESRLKGVMDASNLPQLLAELGPRVVRRVQLEQMLEGDAGVREMFEGVLGLGEAVWKKPVALYVGPLDYSGKAPMPKVAILCDAGKDAPRLAEAVTKLAARIPADAPVKVRAVVAAGDVLIVSNFAYPERIEETLGQRPQFVEALKHGRPSPAAVAYFDAEKVLNVASLAINMAGDAKTTQAWQRMLLTTGVAGVKRLLFTAGFDGRDWGTQAYVEAPQPRMGLLATLLEAKPVSDEVLRRAPQSSTWVAASCVDLAQLVGDVRSAVARIHPETGREVDAVFGDVNSALGIDFQKDLLAALGDQWLAFNSEQTGHGVLGLAVVHPLRDAAKAERSLLALQKHANAMMKGDGEDDPSEPIVQIETTKIGELTVHYLAVPALAPCWAVKDGTLYVAMFPQILVAATEVDGAAAARSVLANEGFAAARKRLGVEATAASVSYMDLPRLAPRGYQMLLALQRTGLGMADMYGLQTPGMVLPPLNKIVPHLTASAAATWVDDAGWHYRGVSPFPGADLLGGEQALITTAAPAAVAAGIPAAAAQARGQARAVQSLSNLRQIGVGALMYSNDNKGNLPPDLGATVKYLNNNAQVYVSPLRKDGSMMMMAPAPGAGADELAKWVNQNSDYVYTGGGGRKVTNLPTNPSEYILAYEKFELAKNGMVGVLYADGHAATVPVALVKQSLGMK